MIPKAIIALVTTILANLFLVLYRQDDISAFIPIIPSLQNGHGISAYDTFLIITIFIYNRIYSSFGITLSSLKNILNIFNNTNLQEIILIAVVVSTIHIFLCPILAAIFYEPIRVISRSHDSIRKVIIIQLPLIWIFLNLLIQTKLACSTSFFQPNSFGGNIPQPPNWP